MDGSSLALPPGKRLHHYGKSALLKGEDPPFLWPFSTAKCQFARGYHSTIQPGGSQEDPLRAALCGGRDDRQTQAAAQLGSIQWRRERFGAIGDLHIDKMGSRLELLRGSQPSNRYFQELTYLETCIF